MGCSPTSEKTIPPGEVPASSGTSAAVSAAAARPPGDGELTNLLASYSAKEFYDQFAEPDSGGRTSYGEYQRHLPRWCDNLEFCRVNARATVRSLTLDPNNLPEFGVVAALYRPAIKKRGRTEGKYGLRMDDALKAYFLVVTPNAGNPDQPAKWRLVGIVNPNQETWAFHEPKFATGNYEECEASVKHLKPKAGFEACGTTADIHELSRERGASFDSLLDIHRNSVRTLASLVLPTTDSASRMLITGPRDFAWTTCLAGCCRATFK